MPRLPLPLPRLTLYTGGKECSLCEVAKEQLALLRKTHPFHLTYFNIRAPPQDVDPREAKKWRRLYHARRMERAKAKGAGGDERDGRGKQAVEHQVKKRFEAYRSVLRFPSLQTAQDTTLTTCNQIPPNPPWRTALGRTFFHLPSPVGEYTQHERNKAEEDECWNCLQQGHSLAQCPYPRDQLQINHSRELFFYARDNLPPPWTERYLHDYLNMRVTVQEKERRLKLLETFRPGEVGKELDQAARMMVDDSDSDEMLVGEVQTTPQKWDKGEYEWIRNIARWGYPPGWTSALSPIEILKDRISSLETYDTAYRLTPEPGEELVIFDDEDEDAELGTPGVTLGSADEGEGIKEEDDDGSEMSIVSDSPSPPLSLSSAPSPRPLSPSDSPPPPSPPSDLPPPPPPPPSGLPPPPPPNRWADYHTDMFASSRLVVYDETRPFVLGTYVL
ncbi:hypothetical protein I310_02022 [Cryptococcus deuterogattii CA1014]|nr:hypothetical protein I310_02022 [Cryptococcus deuterogattii CA1014]